MFGQQAALGSWDGTDRTAAPHVSRGSGLATSEQRIGLQPFWMVPALGLEVALGREGWARASCPAHLGVCRAEGPAKPQGRAPGLGVNQNHWCLTAALPSRTPIPSKPPSRTASQIPKLERRAGPVGAQWQGTQPPAAAEPTGGGARTTPQPLGGPASHRMVEGRTLQGRAGYRPALVSLPVTPKGTVRLSCPQGQQVRPEAGFPAPRGQLRQDLRLEGPRDAPGSGSVPGSVLGPCPRTPDPQMTPTGVCEDEVPVPPQPAGQP